MADETEPDPVRDAAAAMDEMARLALRDLSGPREMSFTSVSTLARLARDGPYRLTTLAVEERVAQPSMTGLVQRLAGRGLVERVPDPLDGRVVRVAITEAGRALLAQRRRARTDRLAELLARLPVGERQTVTTAIAAALPVLRGLTDDLHAEPTQPEKEHA